MSGFGRTGEWFAWQNWAAEPDLIVFAKGSNSGYVPVGGVVISDTIASTFDERVFPGGLTYSGHPLAAASIVGSIDAMTEEGIVDNAKRIGNDVLGPGLRDLQERHPVIGDVRGLGVFWALDLVSDRATKEPLAPYGGTSPAMTEFTVECKKRGLMPFVNFNRTHVVPPCTVSDAEAKEGLAILDEVLSLTDKHYVG
jgi:taurine--2-oxoglutarate transaminase